MMPMVLLTLPNKDDAILYAKLISDLIKVVNENNKAATMLAAKNENELYAIYNTYKVNKPIMVLSNLSTTTYPLLLDM
jgi:mannitol/fructose-specific phosphotransferase system IIA component (Ntr-type)